MSCRDGSRSASMRTRPRSSGCRSRKRPNARKPRTMFFDGSVRSTRRTMSSGRDATSSRSRSSTDVVVSRARRTRRRRSRSDGAVTSVCAAGVRDDVAVDLRAEHVAHARRKLRRHRCVWKPTTSFASRPACTSRRTSSASTDHAPDSGHGTWTKCELSEIRPLAPHHARCEVQVVVLEQHRARPVRGRARRPSRAANAALTGTYPADHASCRASSKSGAYARSHSECWTNHSVGFAATL